jgi:hypothetical protein
MTNALGWRYGDWLILTAAAGVVIARRDPGGNPRSVKQRANHHDPATTSHLAAGKTGSVAKARTIAEKR